MASREVLDGPGKPESVPKKWRLSWRSPSKTGPRMPLYEWQDLRDCLSISWLYMYKDQGLTDIERWAKVTALINKKLATFKGAWDPYSVEKVMWLYGAGVKDDWILPHGLHYGWANIDFKVDNEEVKAKIREYRELEEEMFGDGAV